MDINSIIKQIVKKIVSTAHPAKIILFGSYARGDMQKDSDIDLLVVEKKIQNKGKEMVRLRNAIGNVGFGIDLLVSTPEEIKEWGHLPGSALYSALKEGKTVYEAAH
ncbi:nucleotidyltransferase domain-containing protein [soil metagenome]